MSEYRGERLKIQRASRKFAGRPRAKANRVANFRYERAVILTLGAYERERILCEKRKFSALYPQIFSHRNIRRNHSQAHAEKRLIAQDS